MPARATCRDAMIAQSNGDGPQGGERVIDYNIFLTDAFGGGGGLQESFYGLPGETGIIENDDSYRRSRHLLTRGRGVEGNQVNLDMIRESSLARQLATKEDSVATIRLVRRLNAVEKSKVKSSERHLPWVNLIPPNTKFFLESVQENREEKVQVIDTFGEWIAFFFGRKPEVYSYSGTLLNAKNHDWKNEFQQNYDLFLRGSQAVKHRATMLLQYDDVIVEGYMLNASIQMTAIADNAVPFSFNLLVINRSAVNARGILGARIERSGGTLLEQALFENMNEALDLTQEGRIQDLETFLLMREYFSGAYIPGAGTLVHKTNTGQVEAEACLEPGEKGGVKSPKPTSTPLELSTLNSLEGAGVNSPKFAKFFIPV